jgi:hypothetical protein
LSGFVSILQDVRNRQADSLCLSFLCRREHSIVIRPLMALGVMKLDVAA